MLLNTWNILILFIQYFLEQHSIKQPNALQKWNFSKCKESHFHILFNFVILKSDGYVALDYQTGSQSMSITVII